MVETTRFNFPSLIRSLAPDTVFLLIATGSGYAFSYLYLLVMGRLLGPETFGILGALFAIFYSVCLIGQALMEAIATNVAEIKARSGESAAVSFFIKLITKLSIIYLLPSLILIIASRPVASFFHLTSTGPVIILAVSLFTALLLNTVLGLLQGLQKFRQFGITGYLIAQGLKLLTGVIFVWIGWDLMGAVGALFASTAVGAMVGLFLVRKQLTSDTGNPDRHSPRLGPVLLPALLLALLLSIPASVDVMLVTHFFGGKEAGLYNAVATVGKVVIFLPMAVSLILLPRVTEKHALEYSTRNILLQSLLLAFILSGGVALLCWVFPDTIIRFFFGEAYLEAGALVGLYASAMLLFSLNIVLVHYSLAIRNLWLMLLADIITLAEVVAIVLLHQSLFQIIWILFWGNLLILLVTLPYLVFRRLGQYGHNLER